MIKAPNTSGTLIPGNMHPQRAPAGSWQRKNIMDLAKSASTITSGSNISFLKADKLGHKCRFYLFPCRDKGLIKLKRLFFFFLNLVTFCGKCKILYVWWKFVNPREQELIPTCLVELCRKRTIPIPALWEDLSKVRFITSIFFFSSTIPSKRMTQQGLQNNNKVLQILLLSHNISKSKGNMLPMPCFGHMSINMPPRQWINCNSCRTYSNLGSYLKMTLFFF